MANTGKTSAQFKILYGEGNEQILNTQSESMQKAGHQVDKACNRKLVEALLRHGSYDLVVLGPTLTRDDRHHLPYMVKKAHPNTRVLVLHADGGRHPYVDGNLETGHRLEELLEKITSMRGASAAAAAGR
jgi:DNA-binding NtrC family response regulator